MEKKKNAFVIVAIMCLFVLILVSRFHVGSKEVVKIAVNMPLTGPISSITASYPVGLKCGVEDECRKLNVSASTFVFDIQDNAGQNELAVSIFQKQNMNRYDVVFSGGSAQSESILELVKAERKPHFLFAFDAFMTERDPNIIRVVPNFKMEAPLYVKYACQRNAQKVFAVNLNIKAYEDQYVKLIEPELTRKGIEITRERIGLQFTDYRTLAEKIKLVNPDVLFLSTYAFQLQPMIAALNQVSWIHEGNVYSTIDFIDLLSMGIAMNELRGIAFTCPSFQLRDCSAEAADWKQMWEERFGYKPNYTAAYGYITGRMLVQAFYKFGRIGTRDFIGITPCESLAGPVVLDEFRDLCTTLSIATLDEEGNPKSIE